DTLYHTLDDRNGELSALTTELSRVGINSLTDSLDDVDHHIETGINDLGYMLAQGLEELGDYSRRSLNHLVDIVSNTVENSRNELETGVHHLRNVLFELPEKRQ